MDSAVGRAMFREIARARDPAAVRSVLESYLCGPSHDAAMLFLVAYLSRTVAGFIPDPEHLDP